MRKTLTGMLAGIAMTLASGTAAYSQELTIFWAEWDPANYLQELVNEYEEETGVKVTVETTPWSDFQTKAFTEFNAKGSAYDMVVGDSQWIGAASEAGHYVDLTEFFNKHKLTESMAPATVKYYAEYPASFGQVLVDPGRGRRRRLVLSQGLVRRSEGNGSVQGQVRLRPRACRRTGRQLRDIAEFFHRPDEKRYGVAIYTDNSYDALVMGVENAIFSYRRRARRLRHLQGRRHHQLRAERRRRSKPTRSSTASRLRAGPRASSSRTTRRSPRTWRR